MKKTIGTIVVIAIMLILTGCATVSKEDCLVTDWFEVGRMDGMQGMPRTAFAGRAKACLERGVSADRQAYYRGHDEGLKYYCTEQKGFEMGQQGIPYKSVCPLQLEQDFRAGYQKGIHLFCSEQNGFELGHQGQAYRHICPPEFEQDFRAGYENGRALYQYESKISSLQKQLNTVERKIDKKEKDLYASNLSDEQRMQIRSELQRLDSQFRDLTRQLRYLEQNTPQAQAYEF
jgi:hypothetical protein